MEWSRVQDERPSASTSGGQSAGSVGAVEDAVVVPGFLPAIANKDATSLHVRHLRKKY